jgi:hypothetical protein
MNRELTPELHDKIYSQGYEDAEAELKATKLFGRIKESSKYHGQTKDGEWFRIQFLGECFNNIDGNNNHYSLHDLDIGVEVPKYRGADGETTIFIINQ